MAQAFSRFAVPLSGGEEDVSDPRQIAIDGKTLRGGKDAEGKAEHVPWSHPWTLSRLAARAWKSPMRRAFWTRWI